MRPALLGCALAILGLAARTPSQVDHRISQSPVKNQQGRGTCAAFAICGALETFPGIPTDLSEQLLFARVKLHQQDVDRWLRALAKPTSLKEGDLLDVYTPLFSLVGTCHEAFLPYHPVPGEPGPDVPEEIRQFLEIATMTPAAVQKVREAFGKYGFDDLDAEIIDQEECRGVDRLRQAFDAGALAIPAGYLVLPSAWSDLDRLGLHLGDGKRIVVHPGMMETFARQDSDVWLTYTAAQIEMAKAGEQFVEALASGAWKSRPLVPLKEYGGHAVLLVGYDDRGFLAKNSWGTDWGDGGYFRISYDYHRLYSRQALILERARIRLPRLSPFENRPAIEQGRFRLKIQPIGQGDDAAWQLSTWMLEPRDANVEIVEYAAEVPGENGAWRRVCSRAVAAGPVDERRGMPLVIAGEEHAALRAARDVRFVVRYGVLPFGDPSKPEEARWLRTHIFPIGGPPSMVTCRDLDPLP